MPRFGTKTLLFAFVLVALWFSTFSGYGAGRDVRASVLLIIFLAAGYAAVYSRGSRRAFWTGFFAVMLLCGGNLWQGPANKYVPNFSWRFQQPGPPMAIRYSAPPAVYPYPSDPSPSPQYTPLPAPPITSYVATLPAQSVSDQEFALAVHASVETLWILALACIVGLIGTWLYSSIGQRNGQP